MGCDIHFAVEGRQAGDTWARIERIVPSRWRESGTEREEWFEDRNYSVFAMLAGVRNSHGHEPLAEGRGLPGDASPETVEFLDDCHSTTHFTVRELLAYDLMRTVKHARMTDDRWERDGRHFVPDETGEWGSWAEHEAGQSGKAAAVQAIARKEGEFPFESRWTGEGSGHCASTNSKHHQHIEWEETYLSSMQPFLPTLWPRRGASRLRHRLVRWARA
jgi:hypothetical protein